MMTKILLIASRIVAILCNIFAFINKKIGTIWILAGYRDIPKRTRHL